MDLDRIAPRVDMALSTAIISQVSCGAHENPSHVHELAERKVSEKDAYQKKMYIKDDPQAFRDKGTEAQDSKGNPLDLEEIYPEKMSHKQAGDSDPKEKQEGKVVREERDISYLRTNNPPQEKINEGSEDENVSHEKGGGRNKEKTIEVLKNGDKSRYWLKEELEMSEEDDKKRPVKDQTPEPE